MKKQSVFKGFTRLSLAFCLLVFLGGCTVFVEKPTVSQRTSLVKLKPARYPRFSDHLNYQDLVASLQRSLAYLRRLPPDRIFYFGQEEFSARHLILSLNAFSEFIETAPSVDALNRFIGSEFLVYQSVGGNRRRELLFTGYYEPVIRGSLTKTDVFRYPIYTVPDDLVTIDLSPFSERFRGQTIVARIAGRRVVPYYDRQIIASGDILADVADILAWTDDPVDLFFLQIQGSGKVQLEEGGFLNVHYHASNGRPYRSIGRLLIDEGKIAKEEMSLQKIEAYLEQNPSEIDRILNYNPSYVFFKLEDEGPVGALQETLTALRSIALDRRIFPAGALAYMEAKQPEVNVFGQIEAWVDFKGFILNQDTGGAIRGPGRADLFWGGGPFAKTAAGHMQHSGKLYFLVLRPEHR